jgi:3-hydroxybutyryl-CoA dehydrogenase
MAQDTQVLVVGAGIMGAGIAQVAAQAGHTVWLFDSRDGAAAQAIAQVGKTLAALVAKGRLDGVQADAALARLRPAASLADAAAAGLVIEAIVERLDAKQALLRQIEAVVAPDTVLASNTSSISITAIAAGLLHRGRLVGMHFFNPVPLMKLVEVVSGLHTDNAVAASAFDLAQAWGKTAVHTRSTPGFIVNRIARPYYAEALQLLLEQAATPAVIDACLRGAGFRMGPCELMDLIGHDTNFAVTSSVYEANFQDKRYQPSLLQREMVDGGLLGRKSGRGFYVHGGDPAPTLPAWEPTPPPAAEHLVLHGSGPLAERLARAVGEREIERDTFSGWTGLQVDGAQLRLTDGRTATEIGAQVAVFDLAVHPTMAGGEPGQPLAYAVSGHATPAWAADAGAWLRAAGFHAMPVADSPGLVVARTLAMLVNEACDAVHQGVCSAAGADAAMRLGVNWPAGPFDWLARWNAAAVVRLLDTLDHAYRGERYRVSPALSQRAR